LLELQGFARIRLKPSAQGTLTIPLPAPTGDRTVFMGPSADKDRLLSLAQSAG